MSRKDETHAEKCFRIGENAALEILDNLLKRVKKDEPKPNRIESFGAILAGVSSCLLFRGHREIERMLLEAHQEVVPADEWFQTVISKVLQAFDQDKVPVEARFFIGRKKSG